MCIKQSTMIMNDGCTFAAWPTLVEWMLHHYENSIIIRLPLSFVFRFDENAFIFCLRVPVRAMCAHCIHSIHIAFNFAAIKAGNERISADIKLKSRTNAWESSTRFNSIQFGLSVLASISFAERVVTGDLCPAPPMDKHIFGFHFSVSRLSVWCYYFALCRLKIFFTSIWLNETKTTFFFVWASCVCTRWK